MAERYWYGTIDRPVKRALRNIRKLSDATIGGAITTDELFSIDFDTALATPVKGSLDYNLRSAGYDFRRQETI